MKTRKENDTMNMEKKTFKPIRIRLCSTEFGFKHVFYIDFVVKHRSTVREVANCLIGMGYVAMDYNQNEDCVVVYKRAEARGRYGRVPLTTVGLSRLMGYAA